MVLKLYLDLMSQPSRALFILLKHIKYDFEPQLIDLRKGQQYSEAYTQINRFQKVPVIDHNGFILTESVAILKYLSDESIIPENLYPRTIKERALVNEFLEWQHIGLRMPCAMFTWVKYIAPSMQGTAPDGRLVGTYQRRMESALHDFNTKWLGRGNDFLTGNTVTVADLLAACEIEQPKMARFDPSLKYDNIAVWIKKVQEFFNPHYDEAHAILNKVVEKQKPNSKL